jgi:heptosyltransferase III
MQLLLRIFKSLLRRVRTVFHSPYEAVRALRFFHYNGIIRRKLEEKGYKQFILVVRLNRMGDILLLTSIISHLRESLDNPFVVVAVAPQYAELLHTNRQIDRLELCHCLGESRRLEKRKFFDHVFNLHIPGEQSPGCHFRVPEKKHTAITIDTWFNVHVRLVDVLADLGNIRIPVRNPIHFKIDALIAARMKQTLATFGPSNRVYVVFHTRSGEAQKDWPEHGFHYLARRLWEERKILSIFIGGREDKSNLDMEPNSIDFRGRLTLMETACVIRDAGLFVGLDSGPAHLANAVGTPGVIISGAYRGVAFKSPFNGDYESGKNATIIHDPESIHNVRPEKVYEAIVCRLIDRRGE